MISSHTLEKAIQEAKRFIQAAQQLQDVRQQPGRTVQGHVGTYTFPPSEVREHAATKRASMDLSRKLADLRLSR